MSLRHSVARRGRKDEEEHEKSEPGPQEVETGIAGD